jgi:hypothetical protein
LLRFSGKRQFCQKNWRYQNIYIEIQSSKQF